MRRIIVGLIILSGVFHYKMNGLTRFYPAQFGFFVFSIGLIGSCLLYKKNKWLGLLAGLFSFGFLKTYLFQQAIEVFLFKETIVGIGIFLLYYIVREFNLTENILKWFLIPAGLNIILVLAQKFDGNILNFMPVKNFTGFLGNPSVTSTYIALITPIVLRYYPKFLPLLILTVVVCHSRIPFIVMIVSGLLYLFYENRKWFKIGVTGVVISAILFIVFLSFNRIYRQSWFNWFPERASMIVGTLDGIMHNPVLGWGIGSFEPIMQQIKEEDSVYCGVAFNERDYYADGYKLKKYMNHPHNEYIYGWWNVGILFPVLLLCLLRNISRRFIKEKILSFSILAGGMVLGIGYFFAYPVWFMLVTVLGVYDNREVNYAR